MTKFYYIRHSVSLGVDWEPVSKKEMLFDLRNTHSDAEAAVEYIEENPGERVYGLSYSYKARAAKQEMTKGEIQDLIDEVIEAFAQRNTKVIVYDNAAEYGEVSFEAEGLEVAVIWDADDFDGLFDIRRVERHYIPMTPEETVMHRIGDERLDNLTRENLGERVFDGFFWAYYSDHGGAKAYRDHVKRIGNLAAIRSFMR